MSVDDFDYFEPVGKGGFGRVVRVRKRSTGKFYAMKLMSKTRLAHITRKNPVSLLTERDTYLACDSCFIAKLDYSMQVVTGIRAFRSIVLIWFQNLMKLHSQVYQRLVHK